MLLQHQALLCVPVVEGADMLPQSFGHLRGEPSLLVLDRWEGRGISETVLKVLALEPGQSGKRVYLAPQVHHPADLRVYRPWRWSPGVRAGE
ncbi:MAG: hypothetical protein AAFR28_06465 [Pseudomonadota bacterium]